jgi:hypothetical protein
VETELGHSILYNCLLARWLVNVAFIRRLCHRDWENHESSRDICTSCRNVPADRSGYSSIAP